MRRTISLALVLVACVSVSHAQVRKCVGADGKISYSDVICPGGASEKGVRTDANTIDSTGLRKQAQQATTTTATEQTKLDSAKPAQQPSRLDSEPPPKTILPPKPHRFTR